MGDAKHCFNEQLMAGDLVRQVPGQSGGQMSVPLAKQKNTKTVGHLVLQPELLFPRFF